MSHRFPKYLDLVLAYAIWYALVVPAYLVRPTYLRLCSEGVLRVPPVCPSSCVLLHAMCACVPGAFSRFACVLFLLVFLGFFEIVFHVCSTVNICILAQSNCACIRLQTCFYIIVLRATTAHIAQNSCEMGLESVWNKARTTILRLCEVFPKRAKSNKQTV